MSKLPGLAPGVISIIIQDVLKALQPFIAVTIETCINKAVQDVRATVWEETSYLRDEMLDLQFKIDDNEQYSRRDNIKIVGLDDSHTEDDNTNQLVIDTCQKMGVDITDNDISTSHWLPGKKPMVIAKFTRRDTKKRIMDNKNKLKKGDPTIYEDLTVPRLRLLREVKETVGLKRAFTRDGIIHCIMETDGPDRNRKPG